MKRWRFILVALFIVAFVTTPAFAEDGRDDHVCFGGTTIVRASDMPNSVVLFGCGARIEKGATISRDVVSFGGDIVLEEETRVVGDVVVFGGNVDVAGEVGHRIMAFGGRVTLEPSAIVNDDLVLFGGTINRKQGAIVRGQVRRSGGGFTVIGFSPPVPPFPSTSRVNDWGVWNFIGGIFQSFIVTLGLIALGALISVFMPNQLKQVGDVAQASAMPSLGVGCLTWLVVPPLMILFILTCLGIPVSLVLAIAFVAAGVFGWVAISMVLGDRLVNALKLKNVMPILAMAIGLLVLWLVTSIPFLGGLIWLFVASLAIGAVALTRFGTRPYPMVAPATLTLAPAQPTPSSSPASTEDSAPSI